MNPKPCRNRLLYFFASLGLLNLAGCNGFDVVDALAIGVFNFLAGTVTGTLSNLLPLS